MANLQASSLFRSSSVSFTEIKATLHGPNFQTSKISVPKLLFNELNRKNGLKTFRISNTQMEIRPTIWSNARNDEEIDNSRVVHELYAIMEVAADRAEMHKNIGLQRDDWNHLLLNSVNGMTATATIMAGLAAVGGVGAPFLAVKVSATLLYVAATGILLVMNKIQPSQLAEEQRNASRLFKQLQQEIKTTIDLRNPGFDDVKDAMEKVLALDKAYPLPLLGTMLEKFPAVVEPAVWWPEGKHQQEMGIGSIEKKEEENGWSEKLEQEMKQIVGVLKREDTEEYVRLSKVVLKVNKILAIFGPFLTSVAAIGTAFVGSPSCGSWAAFFGATFGAMATVVNTLEHGGQVGMVFEMYRSSAGTFRLMGETIESTLKEREVDKRENGELFEVKVALQLGRSLEELRDFASASQLSSSCKETNKEEFASKLL